MALKWLQWYNSLYICNSVVCDKICAYLCINHNVLSTFVSKITPYLQTYKCCVGTVIALCYSVMMQLLESPGIMRASKAPTSSLTRSVTSPRAMRALSCSTFLVSVTGLPSQWFTTCIISASGANIWTCKATSCVWDWAHFHMFCLCLKKKRFSECSFEPFLSFVLFYLRALPWHLLDWGAPAQQTPREPLCRHTLHSRTESPPRAWPSCLLHLINTEMNY